MARRTLQERMSQSKAGRSFTDGWGNSLASTVDWTEVPKVRDIDDAIWQCVRPRKGKKTSRKLDMNAWHVIPTSLAKRASDLLQAKFVASPEGQRAITMFPFSFRREWTSHVKHPAAAMLKQLMELPKEAAHLCSTSHCRAGWAVMLAGKKGMELEEKYGPDKAGAMIYARSRPDKKIPSFYTTNREAKKDIEACAKEQRAARRKKAKARAK